MANQKNSRFKRGSGVYPCGACTRLTRATGNSEESCELCFECYEIAGYENYVSDHSNDGDNEAELAHAKAEIIRLTLACIAKGGKLVAPVEEPKAESVTVKNDARKEGIRLYKLAGRPTKEQFIHVFGPRGDRWTWEVRAKQTGFASAEDCAREFQVMLSHTTLSHLTDIKETK